MSRTDLCVIFNPVAGRNRAGGRLEKLRRHLGSHADFRPTTRPGHAEELAFAAAQEGFDIVAAAGGDGTVHEVANGLLTAQRRDVGFCVVPIGSANDYSYSLDREQLGQGNCSANASPKFVDVGVVRDASGRSRYFVNSLGLGLNGAVTLESRKIRRLQGLFLYGLATLRALWYHYATPMMTLRFDGQEWQAPTLLMSIGIGKREGGFVLAPKAKMTDGLFEYLHAGGLSRWEVLRFLPRVASYGPPTDHPKVRVGQCRQLHLRSEQPLTVHIDGEFFSRPEDRIHEITIDILAGGLRVCPLPGLVAK